MILSFVAGSGGIFLILAQDHRTCQRHVQVINDLSFQAGRAFTLVYRHEVSESKLPFHDLIFFKDLLAVFQHFDHARIDGIVGLYFHAGSRFLLHVDV